MTVILKQAAIDNLDEILKLNKALFDFESQFGHDYNLDWTYSEEGKNYFQKRFESDLSIILVAVDREKIIGYILAFIDSFSYLNTNPICEIENMFLEEQYRNQGIGTMLINEVKNQAKEKGAKKLRVGALAQNSEAIKFYHSLGLEDMNLYLESELL